MADLLRIPDDAATLAALADWFRYEMTWQRFEQATDDDLAALLLHRLRDLSVPDPEA